MSTIRLQDGRYFEPESRTPAWMLRTPEFAALVRRSPLAVHVWLILSSYVQTDGTAWCSQRRLAKLTGSYRRSVIEALAVLTERGWVKKIPGTGPDGRRIDPKTGAVLEDLYRLTLPPALESLRAQINARLAGRPADGALPYFLDDDVFQGAAQLYQRMARIPRTTLASLEWSTLRARSGQAMHVYLLLACYAPNGERVGGKRLARECHLARAWTLDPDADPENDDGTAKKTQGVSIARIRAALAVLSDPNDTWISVARRKLESGADGTSTYILVERLLEPAHALDAEDAADEDDGSESEGPPPPERIAELPGPVQEAIGLSDREAWELLHSMGFWPHPDLDEDEGLDGDALPHGQPPANILARLPAAERQLVGLSDADVWEQIRRHRPRHRRRETLDQAAVRMVREFQGEMQPGADVADYQPTPAELELVRTLFRAFGPENAWKVGTLALQQIKTRRWAAGNFAAMRAYIPAAAKQLRLTPKVPLESSGRGRR